MGMSKIRCSSIPAKYTETNLPRRPEEKAAQEVDKAVGRVDYSIHWLNLGFDRLCSHNFWHNSSYKHIFH